MQITVNGSPRELEEGTTVAELLARLDLRAQHVAVEVNQQIVPKIRHGSRELLAGDWVEIVTLVGGG